MFTVTNKISRELVRGLLCCAFEGGSNYWYTELTPDNYPKGWQKLETVNFLDGKPAFEMYGNTLVR